MKIHIIAAALPPRLDGIGDYTALLAAELAKTATVTVLTGHGQTPDPIPGVTVVPAFTAEDPQSYGGLLPIIQDDPPDWVLLQYNPFCYGRRGLNLHLPEVMRQVTRRCPGTKLAVMVHEPFVPLTTWQFIIMSLWQRWQLLRLGHTADALFFAIEWCTRQFQPWFPGKVLHHLPVGSNVPLVPTSRQEARCRLGIAEDVIVIGLFGTASSGRMLDRVRQAAEYTQHNKQKVLIVYIGPDDRVVREALGPLPMLAEGALPAEEVSRRLAAVDVFLTVYTDGVSTRRGSLMAGLQHGLAVVGTQGVLTDRLLSEQNETAMLLSGVDDQDRFCNQVLLLARSQARREQLGQQASHLYQEQFAWPVTARRVMSTLNI